MEINYYDLHITSCLVLIVYTLVQGDEVQEFDLVNGYKSPIKPSRCYEKDEVFQKKCCVLPPFFAAEIANKCGTRAIQTFKMPEQNITGYIRIGMSCQTWKCILDKYHLTVNGLVEEDRFYMHLNRWVGLNPEYEDAVTKANETCYITHIHSHFPMNPCEYVNVQNCFRNYMKMVCPLMVKSPICDMQKKFFDECREYFVKK